MGLSVIQTTLIVASALLSAIVYSCGVAKEKTSAYVEILHEDTGETMRTVVSPEREQALYNELPPVVQEYLKKALPDIQKEKVMDWAALKRVKTLKFKQKGTIRMEDTWVPFTANQHISGVLSNIGFLWDAIVFLPMPMPGFFSPFVHMDLPVTVQDVYVRGKGVLEARLLGVVPVMHFEENPDIDAGELLRWMAEIFFIPTSLVPTEQGEITWRSIDQDPNKVELHVHDVRSDAKLSLTVQFNKEGFPTSFFGMRGKKVGNDFVYGPWEGHVSDYKLQDGMMIPTVADVGWWEDDKLELYFKGECSDFDFEFF